MQSIKAFTMIELIMVVVIIGMVALFAIPNYNRSVGKTYVKTGSNNLLIMYAAQNIKQTAGTGYVACADVGTCNTNLSLSVIGNGFTYNCGTNAAAPPTTFDCRAVRTDNSFTLKITNSNSTVCCLTAGTCFASAPDC